MIIEYQRYEGILDTSILRGVENLYKEIFNTENASKIQERISEKTSVFTILAFYQNSLVGFKIGYELNETTFYSWLGGIKAEFRGYHIASKMMQIQHSWCRAKGYKTIQTKTMNRWKKMLVLNIKSGFDIVQLLTNEKGDVKIVLEKQL